MGTNSDGRFTSIKQGVPLTKKSVGQHAPGNCTLLSQGCVILHTCFLWRVHATKGPYSYELFITEIHFKVCTPLREISANLCEKCVQAEGERKAGGSWIYKTHIPFSSALYRGENKGLYGVARNFFLLLLNCSAWPCLGLA